MGFILIIARDDDSCGQRVRQRLVSLGHPVLHLPEDALLPGLRLTWCLDHGVSSGCIGLGDTQVNLADIDAVLARFYGFTTSAEDYATKDGQYISAEWHAFVEAWLNSLTCLVVDALRPELWYKSHLTSLDLRTLAPRSAFKYPTALVATRDDEARAFYHRCGGRICYSPLSQPSYYPIATDQDLASLKDLAAVLPLTLMEAIPGNPFGVFVTGGETVAVANGAVAANIPPAVCDACRQTAATLGLTFCYFDLIVTSDNQWYCMAATRMPQLAGFTEQVQHAVVEGLVAYLTAATAEGT